MTTSMPVKINSAGTDIAFLGGVINYILTNELDFREYVKAYTNAAVLISDEFRDTEDLDGLAERLRRGHRDLRPRQLAVPGRIRSITTPATRPSRRS